MLSSALRSIPQLLVSPLVLQRLDYGKATDTIIDLFTCLFTRIKKVTASPVSGPRASAAYAKS